MTINRLLQAKLSHALTEKTTAGLFIRGLRRDYWDTPLYSTMRQVGVDLSYAISAEVAIAGELAFVRSQLLSGDEADGVVATVSLTKRFNTAEKK